MDQTNNELGISSLPPEVMERVFEYLPFTERLRASLTCKAWYQLVFTPKFCRNMSICFGQRKALYGNICAYQNYRNACVCANDTVRNRSAMAEFSRAAPLESLMIYGGIDSIDTLLDEYLLLMKQLTTLQVKIKHQFKKGFKIGSKALRISHPSLKALKIDGDSGCSNFEINCPNLTDLCITTNRTVPESESVVQLVIQQQHQLQSLDLFIVGDQPLKMLSNAKLSNLKILRLHIESISNDLELFFNRMVNLVELHLRGDYLVGEELGVLTNLLKLNLYRMAVDTAGFENALRQMDKLKDLCLDQCEFEPPTRSWNIASKNIRDLSVDLRTRCPVILPHCSQLKGLQLTVEAASIDDVFEQACTFYPHLERLDFKGIPLSLGYHRSLWVEFRSPKSFSHITKLKCLKELELHQMYLKDADWLQSTPSSIQKLRLNFCKLLLDNALQSFRSFGPGLRQLHLKYCANMTASDGTLINDAQFHRSLRKLMPWCRIASDYRKTSELDYLMCNYDFDTDGGICNQQV